MTHQTISFIKSFIRVIGFTMLAIDTLNAIFILIIAEIIGVLEELYV